MNFPLFYLFRIFLRSSLVGACPFGSFGDSVLFSFSLDLFSAFSVGVFINFGFGLVFDAFSNFSLTALSLGLLSGFGLFLGSSTGVDDLAFSVVVPLTDGLLPKRGVDLPLVAGLLPGLGVDLPLTPGLLPNLDVGFVLFLFLLLMFCC